MVYVLLKTREASDIIEIMLPLSLSAFTEVHSGNIQYMIALLYMKLALSESIYSLTPSQLQLDFISRYGREQHFY